MKNLVVIPAYNEEDALAGTIGSLQGLTEDYELLLVNDGSRDRTAAVAAVLAESSRRVMHVLHLPVNCGIGGAVQTGYLFAARSSRYRYVIQFDGDGQHPATAIPSLVEACETHGYDLCIGSRFLEPKARGFRSTPLRRIGIYFFCWLIGMLSRARVTDPTSGFRCAGPKAWRGFARHYPEDYPEPESLFWCKRNRLRIGEVAVRMEPRQGGISSIRSLHSIFYMIKVSMSILIDRLRSRDWFSE